MFVQRAEKYSAVHLPPRPGGRGCSPPRLGDRGCSPSRLGDRGCFQSRLGSRGCSPSRLGDRGCSPPRLGGRGCSPSRLGDRGRSPPRLGGRGCSCCLVRKHSRDVAEAGLLTSFPRRDSSAASRRIAEITASGEQVATSVSRTFVHLLVAIARVVTHWKHRQSQHQSEFGWRPTVTAAIALNLGHVARQGALPGGMAAFLAVEAFHNPFIGAFRTAMALLANDDNHQQKRREESDGLVLLTRSYSTLGSSHPSFFLYNPSQNVLYQNTYGTRCPVSQHEDSGTRWTCVPLHHSYSTLGSPHPSFFRDSPLQGVPGRNSYGTRYPASQH